MSKENTIKRNCKNYLDDCVGVFAADPLRPSKEARWPSSASSNELGAFVRSGISPLSMPTFCVMKWQKKNLRKVAEKWNR